jgi:hypothetical protein
MYATSRRPSTILACCLALAALGVALLAGCGGSGKGEEAERSAPSTTEFPSAKDKTMDQLLNDSGAKQTNLVVAPAAQSFVQGVNRYPFGVFTKGNEQIADADVALYFAKDAGSPVEGPLPARVTSLETKPAYRAQTSGAGGDATSVYVVPKVDFDRSGPWLAVAMIKGNGGLEASRVPSPDIGQFPRIPEVGQRPPRIDTPTAQSVGGDLAKIDTRIPPDQMHEVNFADVLGKQPVVLIFATPALCQSRVCGPVVDVAQEVADEYKGKADFIHMEVYNNNEIAKGIRPQLRAFGLESEPWTFLIGKEGKVKDRIEGAYGVPELEEAMKAIVPG